MVLVDTSSWIHFLRPDTLHELEHRGLICNTRKRITLTDVDRLRELTQMH